MTKHGFCKLIFTSLIFLSAITCGAEDFSLILSQYGKPIEKTELESLRKVIWKYPRRSFVFIDGQLQTDRPAVQVAAVAPVKVPVVPAVSANNTAVLTPKVPTAELMKDVFREVRGKNPEGKADGRVAKPDMKRPGPRMPTLPLHPVDTDEEEEEEIG